MKQLIVSKERCIGCGACVMIDSDHFEFDDDGKSKAKTNEFLESDKLLNAMESCPTCAIEIKETAENEKITEGKANSSAPQEECECEKKGKKCENKCCNHIEE